MNNINPANTTPAPATATTSSATSTEAKAPAIIPSTPVPAVQQTTLDRPSEQFAAALPDGYLSKGFYVGEDKGKGRYVDPALVDHAEAIGKALAETGVKPVVLNRMVKTLKTAARLPYEAKRGALKKLAPQVLDLEHRKKAPPLLRQLVERNQAAVQNEADYAACLDHLREIGIYLTAAQS